MGHARVGAKVGLWLGGKVRATVAHVPRTYASAEICGLVPSTWSTGTVDADTVPTRKQMPRSSDRVLLNTS
jgi:hypothetical protein